MKLLMKFSATSLLYISFTFCGVILGASPIWAQSSGIPERALQLSAKKYTPAEVVNATSLSPNPYSSFRNNDEGVDWNFWRAKMSLMSAMNTANNSPAGLHMINRGQKGEITKINRFSTRPSQNDSVEITGTFELPAPVPLIPAAEDEGSIPLATELTVTAGNADIVAATIGDSAFGSAGSGTGDFDFFVFRGVSAGQTMTVKVETPIPFGDLDPYVEIYDSNGVFLAANDDGNPAASFDSFLVFTAPADDDYYVSIGGFGAFFLIDPFDSSTGLGGLFGTISEGDYEATFGLDYFDEEVFEFVSERGDVFGAAISGTAAQLSLTDKTGTERQGSTQDLTGIMPLSSPLPSGLVSVNHVVDESGHYQLRVRAQQAGDYTLNLKAAKPDLYIGAKNEVQIIFVDFDGETVDLSESLAIGAPPGLFVTTLSPLSAFLGDWGLGPTDEDAVIDAVLSVVEQSLLRDIEKFGGDPKFEIELRNSRDHADPFGMENVSRVIVGGTISELFGIPTIGIAQSIDVGNFDTEETAFVLLDLLSGMVSPGSSVNLNNVPVAAGSTIIDVIGRGVGEIVAHEAGHYLGNWHTDQFNLLPNVMDQGGNLDFTILGLGPDGVFGTADDFDVMFGADVYVPTEGLTGVENTSTSIAWGATTPRKK